MLQFSVVRCILDNMLQIPLHQKLINLFALLHHQMLRNMDAYSLKCKENKGMFRLLELSLRFADLACIYHFFRPKMFSQ